MADQETQQQRRDEPWQPLRIFKAPEWGLAAGLVAVLAIIYFLDRDGAFFGAYNIRALLHRVALFGVLAVGAAVVIIAGGIDLSTGAVVALSSVVSAKLLTEWLRNGATSSSGPSLPIVVLAIAITLAMGLCIGLLHALMINGLRIPPFIATLATMAGLRSIATILCQNRTINVPFDAYRVLGKDAWITLSIFSCVAIVMSILMGWTVLGRHLFALGGNEVACAFERAANESPEGRRLRAIRYIVCSRRHSLHRLQRPGRQPSGDNLRAHRDHGGRRRRV